MTLNYIEFTLHLGVDFYNRPIREKFPASQIFHQFHGLLIDGYSGMSLDVIATKKLLIGSKIVAKSRLLSFTH
jgi:hypothetical protein